MPFYLCCLFGRIFLAFLLIPSSELAYGFRRCAIYNLDMGQNTPSVEWGASFSTLRPRDRPDVLQNADVLAVREPLEILDGLEP